MCFPPRGATEGWVLHVLMLPSEVCPQYLLPPGLRLYLFCFSGVLGSQHQALASGPAWAGHSLFCPAAPVTSSLCLSPLPAAPGSSSKAPVIWWQHVPGHSLTSFPFLASPVGKRVKGDQPSHATHQEGHLAMPLAPDTSELGAL